MNTNEIARLVHALNGHDIISVSFIGDTPSVLMRSLPVEVWRVARIEICNGFNGQVVKVSGVIDGVEFHHYFQDGRYPEDEEAMPGVPGDGHQEDGEVSELQHAPSVVEEWIRG